MTLYHFSVYLNGDVDDDQADELAGRCPDTSIVTQGGKTFVHFHREADHLETAIRSALADLSSLGHQAVSVEIEPAAMTA